MGSGASGPCHWCLLPQKTLLQPHSRSAEDGVGRRSKLSCHRYIEDPSCLASAGSSLLPHLVPVPEGHLPTRKECPCNPEHYCRVSAWGSRGAVPHTK